MYCPVLLALTQQNAMEGHPLGHATVFCGRKSGPQQAQLEQGSEHDLLQATDARHALLPHSTSHQVLAPLFLPADCVQACHTSAHAVWHHPGWVGSVY